MSDAKRILIYGDSNSWGYLDDGLGQRFARRWPVELAQHLSAVQPVVFIEECLPGRTTNLSDPVMGTAFNGQEPLEAILLSHQPLDHILIMLGTNDLKARFNRTADDIAAAIVGLAKLARSVPAGRGGWSSDGVPDVSVICPLALGQRANNPTWVRAAEWAGAQEKSAALPVVLQQACTAAGVKMIDGNEFGHSSERDPIHWDEDTHIQFAAGLAGVLQRQLT